MKKLVFSLVLCITISNVFATFTVTKIGSGPWYSYTPTTNSSGDLTNITCAGSGTLGCVFTIINNNYDATDLIGYNNEISYADNQVASNNLSGSHSTQIQVVGEPFVRVYGVIWASASSYTLGRVDH